MALTRRSARFGQRAGDVETLLTERGLSVAPHIIDVILNERIGAVAAVMGISARASLNLTQTTCHAQWQMRSHAPPRACSDPERRLTGRAELPTAPPGHSRSSALPKSTRSALGVGSCSTPPGARFATSAVMIGNRTGWYVPAS